jgi:uncharacterized protein with HEPN domain
LRDDRERLADILEAIDRADLALVWSVVDHDLPSLRKAVADLLDERS